MQSFDDDGPVGELGDDPRLHIDLSDAEFPPEMAVGDSDVSFAGWLGLMSAIEQMMGRLREEIASYLRENGSRS